MGAVLGLAALCLSLLGAFTPGVGLVVGWGALGLASLAALCGGRATVFATVCVSGFAFMFLTPSLWVEALAHQTGYGTATGASPVLKPISLAALAAPIVFMIIRPKRRRPRR